MTTIAYRDGAMAGDSGSLNSGVLYRTTIKVCKGMDGSLHGVTGCSAEAGAYIKWVENGMTGAPPPPEATNREDGRSSYLALVASPKGDNVRIFTAYGWEEFHDIPFIAIGAGAEMAIGAMAAGATAEQAVAIVAEHSTYAAHPVRTISRIIQS